MKFAGNHPRITKDPGYGGLIRVMNKRREFPWIHEKFAGEY